MDEVDLDRDRASQRANVIEQRMFEITIASIDTLKHSTAIEIRKSQNEMKKRLRRYRDRQREIVKSRPGSDKDPIEELITRQMKNKANAREKTQQSRPKTCPAKVGESKVDRTANFDSESDEEIEIDSTFMIDQRRSKIDLRPKTAMEISRRGTTLAKYISIGRLGTALTQIRYFDEDELKDRGHFYQHLVNKRILEEKSHLNRLDDKVADFCGKETVQTMIKKAQAKRNVFSHKLQDNVEHQNSDNSSLGDDKNKSGTENVNPSSSDRHLTVRPHTTHGQPRVAMKTFRSPSYIAT